MSQQKTVLGTPEYSRQYWPTMSMLASSLKYMRKKSFERPGRYKDCIAMEQKLLDKYLKGFKEA